MAPVPGFKSFKNHTRLSRIHVQSNGLSVTWIRPRLVWFYVRFKRMANRISRVFCVILCDFIRFLWLRIRVSGKKSEKVVFLDENKPQNCL